MIASDKKCAYINKPYMRFASFELRMITLGFALVLAFRGTCNEPLANTVHQTLYQITILIHDFFMFSATFPPSAAFMGHWIGSALVRVMACRLLGVKHPTFSRANPWATHSLAVCSSRSRFRPVSAKRVPLLANSKAHPAPIPLLAPVIIWKFRTKMDLWLN